MVTALLWVLAVLALSGVCALVTGEFLDGVAERKLGPPKGGRS